MSVEEDVVFEEGRWGIVVSSNDSFSARHSGCNGADEYGVFDDMWMAWNEITCENCCEVIPDNIQVLIQLLMWGS